MRLFQLSQSNPILIINFQSKVQKIFDKRQDSKKAIIKIIVLWTQY